VESQWHYPVWASSFHPTIKPGTRLDRLKSCFSGITQPGLVVHAQALYQLTLVSVLAILTWVLLKLIFLIFCLSQMLRKMESIWFAHCIKLFCSKLQVMICCSKNVIIICNIKSCIFRIIFQQEISTRLVQSNQLPNCFTRKWITH